MCEERGTENEWGCCLVFDSYVEEAPFRRHPSLLLWHIYDVADAAKGCFDIHTGVHWHGLWSLLKSILMMHLINN